MSSNQRIDRYELLGLLGHGGTGRVYNAWDTKLEREVALKVVMQVADKKIRERFHREVCAIAALRHPNIIEIYDYSGVYTEPLYYVMERLHGEDLFILLQNNGPLPEPATAVIGYELCLALSYMHDIGIIHRDLKPENVFINKDGRVVLTDFGIVKAVRDNSVVSQSADNTDIVGTPGFMSPELLRSKALGAFTDIFALGACLYNIVTGELPFAAATPLELHDNIQRGVVPDIRDYNPQVSDILWDCLRRCLAARPKERPKISAVRKQLKIVLDSYGVGDIREELANYMRNAGVYAESARQRAARRILGELAVAEEAEDSGHVTALRKRLEKVDPDGQQSSHMSDFIEAARNRPHGWESRRHRHRHILLSISIIMLLISSVALALSGKWRIILARLHGTYNSDQLHENNSNTDVEVSITPIRDGVLKFRINAKAKVLVDGQLVKKQELHNKKVSPGHHHIEVIGAHKNLVTEVKIISGRQIWINADLKRGVITVE
ncbi:MAG: serine/threonine protein kinase [Deltaproteobacteria bacterium]|nr:serine/threonine protein kinase [Deltaproteobacteria bacterium]